MIQLCKNCKPHAFQDKEYGINMRVYNPCYKPGSRTILRYRCTVCLNTTDAPKSTIIDSRKEKNND